MKNKGVILSVVGIIIVSALLVVIIKNNTKEFIMYDGAMLALTIDGSPATSFPTYINKYHVDIECDGGVGEYLPDDDYNMKFTIKDITKDGVKCFVDFTTITDSNKSEYLASSIVQSKGTEITSTNNVGSTDTSYRYTGKTPENYVWFNNEMWRIIGLIPVCLEESCGTPDTSLVKIIRNESIGGIAFDAKSSEYTGAWGSNTLYSLLNNYYYGKKNGTNTDYCYGYYNSSFQPVPNCNYSEIGISSDSNDYYGRMVESVYWNTGASSSSGTVNSVYTTETAIQTVSGKIGLMTASDFGYAISGITYSSVILSKLSTDRSDNWLYRHSYELTSVQGSSDAYVLYTVIGYFMDSYAYYGSAVRPVLYLDSEVYIISGDGTENRPYVLGM